MRCGACSGDNPKANRFCQDCGSPLVITCAACSQESPWNASFCGACGAVLTPVKPNARLSGFPRRAAPVIAAELKQVTVLFADLVSSTEMVARLDAEEAMRRLTPALDTMCDAVERYEGTVIKTLGDGIMALFGAPRTKEGHALLACQAALMMREAFLSRGGELSIRVGLHSGEVVADAPTAESTGERTAHGMTIHLASRLPAIVEPGGICITMESFRLVRPFCDVISLGRHTLRGAPEQVELFLLKGLKPAVASQQFRGVSLTTFRGREREMRILRRTLRNGPRVIGIIGAPGTGKSRLCYQFAEWCRGRLIPVFEARAQPYGSAAPLQPVLEFLRNAYFLISPDDDPPSAVRIIAARLAELGPTFETDLPLVCDFLGIPCEESTPSWLSPRARNTRLLEIVRQTVIQRGATASVLIIEDLHWLDEASEEFIATLVEAAATTQTVLVLNFRPSYSAEWMNLPQYQQIELGELSPSEMEQLLRGLIGARPELAEVRLRVAERSGGNPFFAEELVRSLTESLTLVGRKGDYRLGTTVGTNALPATVQAVIGARIDRLVQSERDLLQIGAIIGKEFRLEVLQGVLEWAAADVEATLARLCAGGLLHLVSSPDGRSYGFRHPLIQEVAYATQLKTRRGPLHAAVASAMEQFYNDRVDELAALLSYHFEQAGQPIDAARYAARAARWVGSTSSVQAIRHWHRVRSLMVSQPATRDNDMLRIAASSQIAYLGWREGLTSERARPFIEEALRWARDIDDSMIPLLLFVEGRIAGASGGPADNYVHLVKQGLSLTKPGRDDGRIATLNASLSQAYGWAGLLREALAANDAALAAVHSIADFDHQFLGYNVEHWSQSLRGRILVRLGRFDEAQICFQQMLSIESRLLDPTVQFIANLGYVDLAWSIGDEVMAYDHAAQVTAAAKRHGSRYLHAYSLACEGTAHGIAGAYDRAIECLKEGVRFVRDARVAMEIEPEMLASQADCASRSGDHHGAIKIANEAIKIARQRSARLSECRASISLANALLQANGISAQKEATAHLDHAQALIQTTGACIYDRLLDEAHLLLAEHVKCCLSVGGQRG